MNKFKNVFLILLTASLINTFGANLIMGDTMNLNTSNITYLICAAVTFGIILPPFLLQLSLKNLKDQEIKLSVPYVFKNFIISIIQGIYGVLGGGFLAMSIAIILSFIASPNVISIILLTVGILGAYFFIRKFFEIYLWQNHFAIYFNEFKKSHKKTVSNFKKTFTQTLIPFAVITILPIILGLLTTTISIKSNFLQNEIAQNSIIVLSALFHAGTYSYYYFKTTEITLKHNASNSKK